MGDLTRNFSKSEFASPDGAAMPARYDANLLELARQLQVVRDSLGRAITIHSAYRSPAHNRAVGGVANSRHLRAQAADFSVAGVSLADVYCAVEAHVTAGRMKQGGLGAYAAHTHYDTRGYVSRWTKGAPIPMCGPVPEPKPPEKENDMATDEQLNNRLKVTGWFLIASGFAVAGGSLPNWLKQNLKALLAAS